MHLNPEEKKVGKDNYKAAVASDVTQKFSRRKFVQGAVATGVAAGAGIGVSSFGWSQPDKPLRIGIIGTGDEGNVLIGGINPKYVQVIAIADIRPFNIHRAFHGDESSANALKARPGLLKIYKDWKSKEAAIKSKKVIVYDHDYRDLLKNEDIQGVIIALPLHLHATVAVQAMRAGKHVLTEKLMGHSIQECKEMSRVSFETGRLLATGHQRHYSVLYENAVDLIKMGLLGDLHYIRAQWHRTNMPTKDRSKDSWQPRLEEELRGWIANRTRALKATKSSDTKRIAAIEKQLKLAQLRMMDMGKKMEAVAKEWGYSAPKRGTSNSALEELIRWRLWDRTGGGLMAELGSHQLDAASIFISATSKDGKKVQPLTVTGTGGRHLFPEDRDCDDHVYCTFEFPAPGYEQDKNKKVIVTYSSINGSGFGGYGEVVMGTKGTLILEKEKDVMLFKGSSTSTSVKVAKDKKGAPTLDTTASGAPEVAESKSSGVVSRGYKEEIEHWAWSISKFDEAEYKEKKSDYPRNIRCHPNVAMADAVIALTSNMAIRTGDKITFKPEWFDIDKDDTPEADILGKKDTKPDPTRAYYTDK